MKAILEFKLPEDDHEHGQAINAGAAFSALWEIDAHMRNLLKHGDPSSPVRELAQWVRSRIAETPGVTE